MPNGYIIYGGASLIDSAPIVAIATGFGIASSNHKLGTGLVQVWILRSDMSPVQAVHSGADCSICGTCPLRGTVQNGRVKDRLCYVHAFQGPLWVWRHYKRGGYTMLTDEQSTEVFNNRGIRLGSYGDPAAVPTGVWHAATARAAFWTGYTHQWRTCDPAFARWCMASCETADDRLLAKSLGYRTFRTSLLDARADRLDYEVVCPASAEAGKRTTCDHCHACGGNAGASTRADVVITLHGVAGSRYRKRVLQTFAERGEQLPSTRTSKPNF
jgi:hypothetical protein